MAKNFTVSITKYALNETSPSTTATAIETAIDALNIGSSATVNSITTFKHQGFLWVVVIYEP